MIDFSQSYVTWHTHNNSCGRFQLESLCAISNSEGVLVETLYGLNGVMAGDVYGTSPLLYSPSFFYQAIFTTSQVKIQRSFFPEEEKDSLQAIEQLFSHVEFNTLQQEESKEILSYPEIREATLANQSIVGQLNYKKEDISIELFFPVKHINVSDVKQKFQVETGSIVIPNFDEKPDNWLEVANQAYLAFNNFEAADFLLYDIDKTNTNLKVRRYCKPLHINARIKLWTL